LDFANAFVSPGVNSRGELVPSHGASRRRLGDKKCFSLSACGARQMTEEWGELNINWHLEAFGAIYTQFWAAYMIKYASLKYSRSRFFILKTQLFEIKNYGCYKFLKKTLI
jgi:hypothetical protein